MLNNDQRYFRHPRHPIIRTHNNVPIFPYGLDFYVKRGMITEEQRDNIMNMLTSDQKEMENLALNIIANLKEKYMKRF